MTKKMMTSVKIPAHTEQQLLARVVSDGYKLRGKSKWLIEAIESFLQLPKYYELVEIAQDIEKFDTTLSIRITEELMNKLEKAVIVVRKHYPEMEGVKSNIIRASILQRLLRTEIKYGEKSVPTVNVSI
jgi:hypothetical protein